jgi:hypothetical protein
LVDRDRDHWIGHRLAGSGGGDPAFAARAGFPRSEMEGVIGGIAHRGHALVRHLEAEDRSVIALSSSFGGFAVAVRAGEPLQPPRRRAALASMRAICGP